MATRTYSQILKSLGSIYDPQVSNLETRMGMIPGQIQSEEKGLKARQGEAFNEILGGARRRGLGFSGIPLSEQARYTSTEFLPALARLRQSGREQTMSLQDAILGIRERQSGQALSLQESEKNRAFQSREAKLARMQADRASSRAAASAASEFNIQSYIDKLLSGLGLDGLSTDTMDNETAYQEWLKQNAGNYNVNIGANSTRRLAPGVGVVKRKQSTGTLTNNTSLLTDGQQFNGGLR